MCCDRRVILLQIFFYPWNYQFFLRHCSVTKLFLSKKRIFSGERVCIVSAIVPFIIYQASPLKINGRNDPLKMKYRAFLRSTTKVKHINNQGATVIEHLDRFHRPEDLVHMPQPQSRSGFHSIKPRANKR